MAIHFPLNDVRAKLTPEVRAVFVQATESSTGARHDVEGIAKIVRANGDDTLLVVDAITGLGTTHLDVDGWGVDVIIGGSQKALMIPPGLAYCAVSERAWRRMETTTSPRYYFDLRKERKSAAKGESAYTPATSLFAALGAALEFVREMGNGDLAKGREALVDNAELCAEMTRAGVQALGLKLYAASPAAALTAICPPAGIDSGKIVKEFRESFDAVVANGQGEMKGESIPYRPHRLLRLSGYDRHPGRARARAHARHRESGGVWRSGARSAGSVRARPVRQTTIGERLEERAAMRSSRLVDGKRHGVGRFRRSARRRKCRRRCRGSSL